MKKDGDASWFDNAIIYHILIDRFAGYKTSRGWNHPKFLGGNITGIIDKIPYLSDLGINTILLSPFCKTVSYHGYHIVDYFSVDPNYGTLRDLNNLIKMTSTKNIRLIMDFVPNHCSIKHPFFEDAYTDKKSKYRKWFYFKKFSNGYKSFLSYKELAKINLHHHEAAEHIMHAAEYWLSLGIKGLRIDHVIGLPVQFIRKFVSRIKSQYPDCIILGEAWGAGLSWNELKTVAFPHKYRNWLCRISQEKLQKLYEPYLDGVLDFAFRQFLIDGIAHKKNPDHNQLYEYLDIHYRQYNKNFYLPTFIDNHDTNRFLYASGQEYRKLMSAFEMQFQQRQPPIIYYGTETGLTHHKEVTPFRSFSDLQARKPMNWNVINKEIFAFVKELIYIRKGNK